MRDKSEMLGNEKIGRLLFKLSLPATVGMVVNALYNIFDTIFIGKGVNTLAIGALGIAMPIQMIVMAVAMMIGIGGASIVSRSLGAGDVEKAQKVTGNAFASTSIISVIIVVLGLLFLEPSLRLFGATEEILPYAKDYLKIIYIGTLYFPLVMTANNLIRSEGKAAISMIVMVIGTGLNLILDPLFIFGFKMGVAGAAWATIISQFASFLFIIWYYRTGRSAIKISISDWKIDRGILTEICKVGAPSFIRNFTGSFIAIIVNSSLRHYGGSDAISIFSTVNKVIMFLFMPLFGVVQGMQPIAGFNYGAKKYDRVKEVVKVSIIATMVLATIGFAVGEIFASPILSLFTSEKESFFLSEGTKTLRIIISMIPIIGVQIIGSSLYQALGKSKPAMILTMLRQIILLIPLVIIMPLIMKDSLLGIWLAYPLSDLLSTIITVLFLKKEMKHLSMEAVQA